MNKKDNMDSPLRFLLIDDNPDDRALTIRELRKEFEIQVEEIIDAERFASSLKRGDFDIAITDYQVKWSNGLEILGKIKARYPHCPVIMFTGTGNEEIAVQAMKDGLDDYVIKSPKHFKRLPAALSAAMKKIQHQKAIREAVETLRESEEKYRDLVENINDVIYSTDVEGSITYISPVIEAITGYSPSEMIGRHFAEFIYPDDLSFIMNRFKALLASKIEPSEYRILNKEGGIRWVRTSSRPVIEDNRVVGIRGVLIDITEHKQAEEALEKSESKYQSLVESIPQKIFLKDRDSVYLSCNRSYAEDLAIDPEEISGKDDFMFFPRELAEKYRADDKRIMDTGKTETIEEKYLTKGKEKWVRTTKVPLSREDGETYAIFGIFEDITERKRMEEELLRNQKLEAVGLLAGGIAHDFNNILTTIIGNIAMARMQTRPEDEIFDLLSEAEMASTRAQTLTKQLLTFAKGGALVKETASINTILKESSLFVLRGSKSGCEFSIAEDLFPAEVDIGQISQVINNIVINANQAMPEGGSIQVAAENLIIEDRHGLPVKTGRYIRISVIDQGVGIAQKHLLNIFDPYFTTKQEGRGLGLATTYSIIKKHDGHITVESQLGVGTTFHIYLPASDRAVPEKEEVRLITGQGRILVMDDESSLRKMAGRMLKKLGYESEFAKDGAEAIDMYKAAKESGKPYNAVILDLTIPGGMGGKETINKFLEIEPELKAIVSSGYSDDVVLSDFWEYGFKGMLPKPFESRSLSKVLHEVLKGEKE